MNYIFKLDFWLGISLGLGSMTALRFIGPIGISELILLLVVLIMILKRPQALFSFNLNSFGIFKYYMLATFFIFLPLATLINMNYGYENHAQPLYLISFSFSAILVLLCAEFFKTNRLSLKLVTYAFATGFILPNLFVLIFGIEPSFQSTGRYAGVAENPNQITFYSAPLMLMLSLYATKYKYTLMGLTLLITLLTASDAYLLYVFIVLAAYTLMIIFANKNLSFVARLLFSVSILIIFCASILILFNQELILLWRTADEAGSRFQLIYHGIYAAIESPLIGHGAGRFSGISAPFLGWEAHNTPIDLMTNFGLIFPFILYVIVVLAAINLFKYKQYLSSSLVIGFIESTIFHYSARHFIFWFMISVLCLIVFRLTKEKSLIKKTS